MKGVLRSPLIPACIALITLFLPSWSSANPGGERTDTTKTGWTWYYNINEAQLQTALASGTQRMMDLEVHPPATAGADPTYSAALVANSGVHASGWWWYYNVSVSQISSLLTANNARLIDIERWPDENSSRFAVIMVPNTGANAKNWYWYVNASTSFLSSQISSLNLRMIDLEPRLSSGSWVADAILIENSGADALGWSWYVNAPKATIDNAISNNNQRLYEIEVANSSATNFHGILIQNAAPVATKWWWYFGLNGGDIAAFYEQNGARITDIQPYQTTSGATRYAVIMIQNMNDLELQMACDLDFGSDGATGFRLEEIGAGPAAQNNVSFAFEPASTIKAVHLATYLYFKSQGARTLGQTIAEDQGLFGSCPDGSGPVVNRVARDLLEEMMVNSSNTATETIRDDVGNLWLDYTMYTLAGMSGASGLNHQPIGCAGPALSNPNQLTLNDASLLWEKAADATLFGGDLACRDDFLDIAWGEEESGWFQDDLRQIVDEEAILYGDPLLADEYWNRINLAYKAGGYDFNVGEGSIFYRSVAGWVQLPTCRPSAATRDTARQYTFGLFIDRATNAANADARLRMTAELLRPAIRETMIFCTRVDAPQLPAMLSEARLEPAFPNPFNPRTTLRFALERAGEVELNILDMRGRLLRPLLAEPRGVGSHSLQWDGLDESGQPVASGIYFVQLKALGTVDRQKIILGK